MTLGDGGAPWDRVFSVGPLVLVGTRERGGGYNLAPKHAAFPLGWGEFFGFVCTPRHGTYHNARREGVFTVSYPLPTRVVLTSLAASPREGDGSKPLLDVLGTLPAAEVDGILVRDAYLHIECALDRVVDDFGENSLVCGRVLAAHAREDHLRAPDRDDGDLIHASPLLASRNRAATRASRIATLYQQASRGRGRGMGLARELLRHLGEERRAMVGFLERLAVLPMMVLAEQYGAASTGAQRSALVAAGEAVLARGADFTPGSLPGFVLTSLAQIAISVVMLRGGVFGRVAAWAGISGFALLLIFTGWTTLVPGALEGALLVALPAGLLVVAALWRILYRR